MKMIIKYLIVVVLFMLSAMVNAQTISSLKLMDIADKIDNLSIQMSKYNVGPDQTERNRWSSLRESVHQSAQAYQLAALETLIVEQKVDILLRQYRLGKKLADSTNKNEAFFHVWKAYKLTELSIDYLRKMAMFYPSLNDIQQNLSVLNEQAAPYVR